MKEKELRVVEIAECIYKEMKNRSYRITQGIFGENFGALLFLYYYADFAKEKKYSLLADSLLDKLLFQLEGNIPGFSFCNGYAGILYLFQFLQGKKYVNLDFTDSDETIDTYLIKQARNCMRVNDYDYLHGALGVALYFLEKNPNHPFLNEFVNHLYYTAEKDSHNKTFKWKTPYGINWIYDYHISLSHGMASIVIFLSRLLKSETFSSSKKCLAMLKGCMNYILLQEIDYMQYGSHFPHVSLENNHTPKQSRLGWCFGDLGIASALWQAGKIIHNQSWKDKATNIMEHASQRVNWNQTAVNDCGICHGSAGIAMMFRRFYLETHNEVFYDAGKHWIDFTLNFKRFDDGLAGFKTNESQEWNNDISLLTGISGIGLVLLSFIQDGLQEWDELFIIS